MSLLRAALAKRRASAGSNNITVANHAGGGGTSSTTTATTSSITSTTGNTFLVGVCGFGSSVPTPSVTDNKGNTYTQIGTLNRNATDTIAIAVFICVGGTGGAGHTFTGTMTGNNYVGVLALEIAGTTGVQDGNAHANTSGTSFTSGNITTTNANDTLFGFCMNDANTYPQGVTASNGSLIQSVNCTANNLGIGASSLALTATGTNAMTFSGAPNSVYGGVTAVALKST